MRIVEARTDKGVAPILDGSALGKGVGLAARGNGRDIAAGNCHG
jgi:hypothetical protein